jgi:putative endonuclease
VLIESCEDIRDAIQRESSIKHWPRTWNVRLIHAANPDWRDLYEDLNA